ncbi:MAG: M48 family metallopeptidase [Anaerolineales bacterium]|nr:M48 family metallopeptidase [Anaerolineales bacterium]
MTQKQDDTWPVEVVRSARRTKSVSAELRQGVLVVRAPAGMSDAELQPIIARLRARLQKRVRPAPQTDNALEAVARRLNAQYFDGKLRWQSVRYVANQQKRFGSCTPARGTIRISDRLATMPAWVRDYVVMHELAHLLVAGHGPRFWELVNRYPLTERARGYLMAVGLEEADGSG